MAMNQAMFEAIATHAHWAGPALMAMLLVQVMALVVAEQVLEGIDLTTFRRTLRPVLSATTMVAIVFGCLWAWAMFAR